jgi:hypothetical protein
MYSTMSYDRQTIARRISVDDYQKLSISYMVHSLFLSLLCALTIVFKGLCKYRHHCHKSSLFRVVIHLPAEAEAQRRKAAEEAAEEQRREEQRKQASRERRRAARERRTQREQAEAEAAAKEAEARERERQAEGRRRRRGRSRSREPRPRPAGRLEQALKIMGLTVAVLKLSSKEAVTVIKNRFRTLAMKFHPDRGGDANKFMAMNEAYEYLLRRCTG